MSSPVQRRSIDSYETPQSPSLRSPAYPFPYSNGPHRPTTDRRLSSRRGSITSVSSYNSTTHSIGGALDTQSHRRTGSVKEAGQNGQMRYSGSNWLVALLTYRSDIQPFTNPYRPHRSLAIHIGQFYRIQSAHYTRYSPSHFDKHSTCRPVSLPRLPVSLWTALRALAT